MRTSPPPPSDDDDASNDTRATETTSSTRRAEARRGYALLVSSEDGVSVRMLEGPRVVIGRGSDCEVVVNDSSISRRHARLLLDESLTLEDLGSTNGTRVQGRRIERGDRVPVSPGIVFELGSATFVLQRTRGLVDIRPPAVGPGTRTDAPPSPDAPVVQDPTMRHLYALLNVIAPTPLHVLILGETGVGKELFADAIHKRSDRRDKVFLRLSCAALPQSILEGELFGYEKGAFTGAVQAKAGLFESADKGTVFLDEIGEMPMETQAKLLRVLENGEVLRLGALEPRCVDVRFVAATNRDLRQRIVEGAFRSDVYFRLNGMSVTLPPLRKRTAEIAPLARHVLDRAAARMARAPVEVSEAAIEALKGYTWPGNVRELKNVLERAFVLAEGDAIDVRHLAMAAPEEFGVEQTDAASTSPGSMRTSASWPVATTAPPPLHPVPRAPQASLRDEVRELERHRIGDALAKTGSNQSEAAKILGMSRYTLIARMDEYGMTRPRKRRREQ